jgi:ATP/maltotriose-dependent transcriptional regulator MalT
MEGAASSPWYGRALQGAAAIAYRRGTYDAAISHLDAAARVAMETGNVDLAAAVTLLLGNVAFDHGDLESALDQYRLGLQKYRTTGNEEGIADARAKQGLVLTALGNLDDAAEALNEALEIGRRLDRPIWSATAIGRLAFLDQLRGDLDGAERRVTEILPIQRQLNPITAVATLWCGATVARDTGAYPLAAERYRESLELRWQWGERRGIAEAIAGIAELAILSGHGEAGLRLFGGLETMRAIVGVPGYRWEQSHRDHALAGARRQLGQRAFDRAYGAGRSLSREETFRLAIEIADQIECPDIAPVAPPTVAAAQAELPHLTSRELEVLRSLAQGLSDREIGQMLFISPRTVARHLHSIYQKLEVTSRSGATAFAHRNGLIDQQS